MNALLRRAAAALPWFALAAGVVLADQLTKQWILRTLAGPGDSIAVVDCFNLVLAFNRGAAFSFLNDAGGWQSAVFLAIGAAACLYLVVLLLRLEGRPAFAVALALILGGALGNVVDRLRYQHVVDFLDFHWRWLAPLFPGGHFPAFNLADSAISCGAVLLILEEFVHARRGPPAAST